LELLKGADFITIINNIVADANKSAASAEYDSKEFEFVISGGLYLL